VKYLRSIIFNVRKEKTDTSKKERRSFSEEKLQGERF
jgi:hypothetical protein